MGKHDKEKAESKQKPEQEEAAQSGPVSERVEIARAEYEELLRKAGEFAQLQDRLLRSAADFDNAKKRLAKEREEFVKFGLEEIVHDLLTVLDHFELAFNHLQGEDEKTKSVRNGFLMIQKQLVQILTARGLKRIETNGKTFDPHIHEAVGHIIAPDKPEGIILEEILSGYELNGKLIRAAKVRISAQQEIRPDEKVDELT